MTKPRVGDRVMLTCECCKGMTRTVLAVDGRIRARRAGK
jgi:hypothetical protein